MPPPNVSLVMITADGKSKELPAMRLPILIGRSEDCKLRIPVPAVSRHHCELTEDDDELVVKDLKSSNGTFVNKERVKVRELLPGDLLCVGPAVLVVRIDGHPKAIDPIISWANGAVSATEAKESEREAMDGVPSWKGGGGGAEGAPASGSGTGAPAAPAAPKPAAKSAAKPAPTLPAKAPGKAPASSEDDLSSIIADLSESDFDIDFGEDDAPKGPKPPAKK